MGARTRPSPMSVKEVVDRYFLENRARLIEVAAFLDRIDRCRDAETARADYRYRALSEAVRSLGSKQRDRTSSLHELFSDPTEAPLASAEGLPPASGAWDSGAGEEGR